MLNEWDESQQDWAQPDQAVIDAICVPDKDVTFIPEKIDCEVHTVEQIKSFCEENPNSYLIIKTNQTGLLRLDKRRANMTYLVMFKPTLKDTLNSLNK